MKCCRLHREKDKSFFFKDSDAEYLAFSTLFCGQKRVANSDRHVPVYYSDICKWELRGVDRRIALHVPNILFKMKKKCR